MVKVAVLSKELDFALAMLSSILLASSLVLAVNLELLTNIVLLSDQTHPALLMRFCASVAACNYGIVFKKLLFSWKICVRSSCIYEFKESMFSNSVHLLIHILCILQIYSFCSDFTHTGLGVVNMMLLEIYQLFEQLLCTRVGKQTFVSIQ